MCADSTVCEYIQQIHGVSQFVVAAAPAPPAAAPAPAAAAAAAATAAAAAAATATATTTTTILAPRNSIQSQINIYIIQICCLNLSLSI